MWKVYSSNMQQYSFFYRFLQGEELIILSILWIWKRNSSKWACLDYAVKANYISYTGIARFNCAQPNIQK